MHRTREGVLEPAPPVDPFNIAKVQDLEKNTRKLRNTYKHRLSMFRRFHKCVCMCFSNFYAGGLEHLYNTNETYETTYEHHVCVSCHKLS